MQTQARAAFPGVRQKGGHDSYVRLNRAKSGATEALAGGLDFDVRTNPLTF